MFFFSNVRKYLKKTIPPEIRTRMITDSRKYFFIKSPIITKIMLLFSLKRMLILFPGQIHGTG
jgi:hypothetical protein